LPEQRQLFLVEIEDEKIAISMTNETLLTSQWFFKHFERLLSFSDGVFAIAITLMVLTLGVPVLIGSSSGPYLVAGLIAEWPAFLGYFISFFVIGMWWIVHHRYFQYLTGFDFRLLWLNLLFLLCITLIPFLTNLIVVYHESVLAVSLYASFQALAGCFMFVIWKYSTDYHRFVDPSINPRFVRYLSLRTVSTILSFLASIPIAIISPTAAQVSWVIIPFFHGFLVRHTPKGYQFNDIQP
jgi:uncharacterized membrane protein